MLCLKCPVIFVKETIPIFIPFSIGSGWTRTAFRFTLCLRHVSATQRTQPPHDSTLLFIIIIIFILFHRH